MSMRADLAGTSDWGFRVWELHAVCDGAKVVLMASRIL